MTIICALHADGATWIGSDSLATFDGERSMAPVEKWVARSDGRCAVGFSGHSRAAQVARKQLFGVAGNTLDAWEVAQALRVVLVADGWRPVDGDGAPRHDVNMVFASLTEVALIDMAFAVHRFPAGILATCGSGSAYAEGAAWACGGVAAPDEQVHTAVSAACRFDTRCGGDIVVRKLEALA